MQKNYTKILCAEKSNFVPFYENQRMGIHIFILILFEGVLSLNQWFRYINKKGMGYEIYDE